MDEKAKKVTTHELLVLVKKVVELQAAIVNWQIKTREKISEALAIVLLVAVALFLVAFFRVEILAFINSVFSSIAEFFGYIQSLWPKLTPGEQIISLITLFVGIPAWFGGSWWARRKNK